jgi:hypothetical protein
LIRAHDPGIKSHKSDLPPDLPQPADRHAGRQAGRQADKHLVRPQRDMLDTERAAADGIGLLARVLLIPRTDGEVVDEPQRRVPLRVLWVLRLEPRRDLLADPLDFFLQSG